MKHKFRKLVSLTLAVALILGMIPAASAIQDTTYHDPAENWLDTAGRTGTFDANAVVTNGTMYCRYCTAEQNGNAGLQPFVYTPCLFYRVPEYTSDGRSNATRNIRYSDGVMVDEESSGNVMYTSPNSGGIYTGYHWTKSMCLKCGRLNTNDYTTSHGYLKDVYSLYSCDSQFDQQTLPENTEWAYLDDTRHTKTVTSGTYCGFCYGTHTTTSSVIERHDMETEILPQPANGRFATVEHCTGCDYSTYSYTTAKAVIASYYGVVDGQPHTITVSDLSESGVSTQIRYGNSAASCTLTSAPNYTEAGEYSIYYEITYTYQNTSMTENGVANVWLREESASTDGSCACGCGDPDCGCQDKNCAGDCCSSGTCGDDHNFVLLDSVSPSCLTLGYSRYLCVGCGKIEKRDYVNALGHNWQSIVVRDATCETDGKQVNICQRCGQVETVSIPKDAHSYTTYSVKATCTSPGYTIKECSVCGERTITNITNALSHNYKSIVTPPTCENGGHTLHLCEGCGSSFVTDYTDPLGHSWDEGTEITLSTCGGQGVMEYRCQRCGYHRLEATFALGHTPGGEATCTDPQLCTECGAVIQKALGHDYESEVTDPTCTEMGYTTCTCSRCGDSYKTDYTKPNGHTPGIWIIDLEPTTETEGKKHIECEICGEELETAAIEKLPPEPVIVSHGAYILGYPDGTFGPENSMTRAEASAILARLLAERKGESIQTSAVTKFTDVPMNTWYSGYVKYLNNYGVVYGSGGNFRPHDAITRAEFVAMVVRFFNAYGDGDTALMEQYQRYDDVSEGDWAETYIEEATRRGWIQGYGDGTFRSEKPITRAEAVTIMNRLLGRTADEDYISQNIRKINTFTDMADSHWAYYDVLESANAHTATYIGAESETWSK